jgi:acyl-CoA synthetase (AMP-forming)/AMP-acid ligase II
MAVEDMRADELAALFYTSGTTGFPKGAMLTHGNIVSALESAQRALLLPAGVRTLVPVPLFHVMGALNQLLPTCRAGGTTVIMRGFDVPRWLDAIRSERINVVSAVPAIYWQALQHPDFDQLNTGGVGWVVYGGAATPPEQVRRLSSAFPGARLFSGYGLTESSGGVTGLPHEFAEERADSVGVALPTVEIAVRGPSAAQGCGELLLRAPQIMAGYWQRPDETADVTIDGWFATGDAVEVSTDGFIRIVDRIKDTINRGGENVYCIEVENVLGAHPDVAEVAVIGVADPMMGEKVGAVVVPAADAAIEPAALVAWAGERMADFKVPQYVHVASQPLPRNAAGKVNKPALRSSTTWGTPLR